MGVQILKKCYFGGPPAESPTFECHLNWLVESPLLKQVTLGTSLLASDEKSTKASLPPSAMRGRYVCQHCGKSLSKSTKHDWKACENFRKKRKRTEPIIPTTPKSQELDITRILSPCRNQIFSLEGIDDCFTSEL